MSILGRQQQTLKRWGLNENPFRPTPPEDPEKLSRIFYGREAEMEIALPALYEGRNVLLRGAWGIGKTTLILTLLNRLKQEVAELGEEMLILYLGQVIGESPTDFYRALLLTLANALAAEDEEAKAIADGIRGLSVQPEKISTEGKVNLWMFSLGVRQDSPTQQLSLANVDPYSLLIPLLDRAQTRYNRIVLAVDDLDKKDVPVVQDILEGSLDLFRRGEKRSFLITGRGFTDLQEATLRALGIFSEDLSLEPMQPAELRQIAINYLNLARNTPRQDTYPFTDEVMERITQYAQGTPRQLNIICEKVLRQAAQMNPEVIDLPAFEAIWQTVRQQVTYNLTPHLRRLLYVAYEAKGISEDITDQYLDRIGVLTFVQLLPMLKALEEQELLIRQETESGYRFVPSQLFLPEPEQRQEPG